MPGAGEALWGQAGGLAGLAGLVELAGLVGLEAKIATRPSEYQDS